MDADSVDAIVTDPPYGLGFMGRKWDALPPGREWAELCLRVLKPGGHLLAFGGTRTYHRLACAVEDAGLEIRDCLAWLYGSGFPKSHDVSKAIDKAAGADRPRTAPQRRARPSSSIHTSGFGKDGWTPQVDDPQTAAAAAAAGWGTALKPAFEPIVLARRPLEGTVAANFQAHRTGALNIDAARIPTDERWQGRDMPDARDGVAWGGALNSSSSSHPGGRWPANVVLDDAAADLLDEQTGHLHAPGNTPASLGDPSAPRYEGGLGFGWGRKGGPAHIFGDSGGASRFFYCAKASTSERNAGLEQLAPCFAATMNGGIGAREHDPKQPTAWRPNHHPTVKPIALMRWLIRLATPPGGTVLDPFTGSGSTGCAAVLEGFRFLGIEREPEYAEIARARIAHWEGTLEAAA